jgi:hypothetical protein
MKKLILTMALGVGLASAAYAQGTINFASAAAGVNWKTTNSVGQLALGAAYLADFYFGAGGTNEAGLIALGLPAPFNTGAQAGYFTGGARTIPGYAGGTTITGQVRVWAAASGSTYEAAFASGETGKSITFQLQLATPPATPTSLTPLGTGGGLTLVAAPEPSTFALAGLGAAAVLIFRRRKQ